MAYTTIDKPSDYFNTVLWTGDGTDDRNITGVGFQPDMVWEKKRSEAGSHRIADSIRGATNVCFPDLTNAEASRPNEFQSFLSDGFQIGSDDNFNGSSKTYVGWSWLASNTTASNTDGTITSTVSANTTSGFSIVSYTGTGANATVGHGLGVAPSWIVIKGRNQVEDWTTYHISTGNTKNNILNSSAVPDISSTYWQNTSPTSSVFYLGSSTRPNNSGTNYIAYCFADVKGYSKFNSYTGNGNADGTFIYTGFKPAYLMIKNVDTGTGFWTIWDNKRNTYNPENTYLIPSTNEADGSESGGVDFLSNGFKLRNAFNYSNASAINYIYMSFAESPFTTSTGIPTTAR